MKKINVCALAAALLLAPCLALAAAKGPGRAAHSPDSQECVEPADTIAGDFMKRRKYLPARDEAIDIASTCKEWPGKQAWTLGVFVYDTDKENNKRMLVALLDLKKKVVVASYVTTVEEDPVVRYVSDALRLDTARYQLRDDVRAFGLDVATHIPQLADRGFGPQRTLFVRDGAAIRPVLSDMSMFTWGYVDGKAPWDKDKNGKDIGERSESWSMAYSIGIAKTSSNGYADLIITAKSDDKKAAPTTELMRYDGKRYPAPKQQ